MKWFMAGFSYPLTLQRDIEIVQQQENVAA